MVEEKHESGTRSHMKTAVRITLSTAGAAIVHWCVFQLLWGVFYGIDWLFAGPGASFWLATVSGCILCYLPAVLTGAIVARVQGLYRPIITAPLGVIVFWALFLVSARSACPTAYWSVGPASLVPWPFDYWTVRPLFPVAVRFAVDGLRGATGRRLEVSASA